VIKASWDNKRSDSMYRDALGPCLKSSEPITQPEHDYKVLVSHLGESPLCIPHSVKPRETRGESQTMGLHGAAAMDSGVRTFVAIYDANGPVTSWGGGDMDDRIFREMYATDRLRKRIAKMEKTPQTKTKRRRRRHRALLRKLQRIRNLVDNMHYNLIAWLVDTFKVILIPWFEVSAWLRRRAASSARRPVQVAALHLPAAATGQGGAAAWVYRHRM